MDNIVIIGNSAAALSAVETIIKSDSNSSVTMICDEKGPAYSRVLISYLISEEMTKERMYLKDMNFYKMNNIKTIFGNRAVKILPKEKGVILENNKIIKYDRLLIATGARPYFPDIKGIEKDGVFGLRTIPDAISIHQRVKMAKRAVILGGGLISLKASLAIHKHDLDITLIVGSNQILLQMLDYRSASFIRESLEKKGYKALTSSDVREIGGSNGKVEEVVLTSGKRIPADIVIVGKGIVPNTELVEDTGIELDKGIIVNDYMETNIKDIYAAGDVAQGSDLVRKGKYITGTWPVAIAQGRIAGYNFVGRKKKYIGALVMNVIDVYGITVASVGITHLPENKSGYEEVVIEGQNNYKKLVIRNNLIVGGVFIGDIKISGLILSLIRKRVSLDRLPTPKKLLQGYDYVRLLKYIQKIYN